MAERVLTDLQKAFLSHLLGEARGNFHLAKKLAGYSDTTPVSEIVRSLREELREAATDALNIASVQASFELQSIMESPTKGGASVALKAAQQILDRVGVKQNEGEVKVPQGGIVIMPAKNVKVSNISIQTEVDEPYDLGDSDEF